MGKRKEKAKRLLADKHFEKKSVTLEEAKELVFHDADMELYADFIELIDSYHYNVQVPAEEIIRKQYEEDGVEYYNITK